MLDRLAARVAQVNRRVDDINDRHAATGAALAALTARVGPRSFLLGDTATGWSADFASPTVAIDTTVKWSGTGSFKMTRTAGALITAKSADVDCVGLHRVDLSAMYLAEDASGVSARLTVTLWSAGHLFALNALGPPVPLVNYAWAEARVGFTVPDWVETFTAYVYADGLSAVAKSVWVDDLYMVGEM